MHLCICASIGGDCVAEPRRRSWGNDDVYSILCVLKKSKVICNLIDKFQLKIFPESSRMAVYSYLGIPYAQAPIGNLRFAVSKLLFTLR